MYQLLKYNKEVDGLLILMTEDETIEVMLPKNKTTLAFLSLHMREKLICVDLGMKFLTTGNNTLQCWDNAQWEQKIKGYQKELLREKEKQRVQFEDYNERQIELAKTIRANESARYKGDIEVYRGKIASLEGKLDTEVDKYRSLHQKLTQEFAERGRERESKYEAKLVELERKLELARKTKDELMVRGQNSTFLGQDGENLTCQALTCLFPKAEIIDTHASGGRGDFVLKEGDICCMIETKNHKTNVGRVDVDKFYNDIESNDEFQCGIFASLKSGIVNRSDFHLEFRNKKPILFLTNIKDNMKHLTLAFCIFRVLIGIKDLDVTEKEKIDRIQHVIPVIKRKWKTMRSTITTFQTQMFKLINEQEESIKMMLSF